MDSWWGLSQHQCSILCIGLLRFRIPDPPRRIKTAWTIKWVMPFYDLTLRCISKSAYAPGLITWNTAEGLGHKITMGNPSVFVKISVWLPQDAKITLDWNKINTYFLILQSRGRGWLLILLPHSSAIPTGFPLSVWLKMTHQVHIPALKKVKKGEVQMWKLHISHLLTSHWPKISHDHTYIWGMLGNIIFTREVMWSANNLHY